MDQNWNETEFHSWNELQKIALQNMKQNSSTIMGLDLSTTNTGLYLLGKDLDKGYIIKPKAKLCVNERIDFIVHILLQAIVSYAPALVVLEEPIIGRNSHGSLILAQLGGIVRYQLRLDLVRYIEIYPSTLKMYITGRGNANKEEIKEAIELEFQKIIDNDNVADAFGLAMIGQAVLYPQIREVLLRKKETLNKDRIKIIEDVDFVV